MLSIVPGRCRLEPTWLDMGSDRHGSTLNRANAVRQHSGSIRLVIGPDRLLDIGPVRLGSTWARVDSARHWP